jgi:type VI secretion system FHA domain protein
MTLRLTLEQAPHRQRMTEVQHDGGDFVIGRAPESDWQLDDPDMFVSRSHAVISGRDGRYTVTDSSRGGLFIDGSDRALGAGNSVLLEDGMRLRLGDFVVRVAITAAGNTPARPAPGGRLDSDGFFSTPVAREAPVQRPRDLPEPFETARPRQYVDDGPKREPGRAMFDDPFTLDPVASRPAPDWPGSAAPPRSSPSPVRPMARSPWGDDPSPADPGPASRGLANPGSANPGSDSPPSAPFFGDAPGKPSAPPPPAPVDPFGFDWPAPPPQVAEPPPVADFDFGPRGAVAPPAFDPDPALPAGATPTPAANPVPNPAPERISDRAPEPSPGFWRPEIPDFSGRAAAPAAGPAGTPASTPSAPMAAPTAAPGPATAQAAPAASDDALRAAFFRGLGIEATAGADPEAEMEALGRRFRALTEGLVQHLRTRAREKQDVRAAATVIGSADVNPLKFLPGADEAVAALVAARGKGYLDPDRAIQGAWRDLADHQVRSWAAMQAALRRMIDRFDPAEIEAEIEKAGLLTTLLAGGKGAKLWQLYRERYAQIARSAEDRFLGEVGADFRDAYEGNRRD